MARRAAGTRDECEGLFEIDEHATRGKTKKMKKLDLMILDMERTCSTWNKTAAYKAGKAKPNTVSYVDRRREQAIYGNAKRWSKRGRKPMRRSQHSMNERSPQQ